MADSDKCPFCNERHKPNHVGGEISSKMSRAQFSRGISRGCQNPFCNAPVLSSARGTRLSCSDRCRQIHSILNRAARMLLPLGSAEAWEMLQQLENGDSQGKPQAEIMRYKAN